MNTHNKLVLPINELVTSLTLCGYDKVASQIINEQQLFTGELEFERFIEQSENMLRMKGLLDETRDSTLVSGLENMLHLLVNSTKKVRFVIGSSVLFIHLLNTKHSLVQLVLDQTHTFHFHENSAAFNLLLEPYIMTDDASSNTVNQFEPFELSSSYFDEIFSMEEDQLDGMISDQDIPLSVRSYLTDFQRNNRRYDNVSFLITNYVKDTATTDSVSFLLPSQGHVWHLDYEQVAQDKILIIPVSHHAYLEEINHAIYQFFNLHTYNHS